MVIEMSKALILAGGMGKRMNSPTPKVAHEMLGKPLINWVIDAARSSGIEEIGVVVGHGSEIITSMLPAGVKTFIQKAQLGTADAVKSAMDFIDDRIIVLYGDVPLISSTIISDLTNFDGDLVILTAKVTDPSGYGRIVRKDRKILKVVEEADASPKILKINEINTGIYAFKPEALLYALKVIKNENKKGEYYLTDAIEILSNAGYVIKTLQIDDPSMALGINTQRELSDLSKIAREMIIDALMDHGVTIEDPETTFIGPDAIIESGAVLRPFTFVYGKSRVSSKAIIGPETTLVDTTVGVNSSVVRSDCTGALISADCTVGPFSRLRPGVVLEAHVKIGNYVEVKNSHLEEGVKAQHLTYLGDATIGENTNVGAGTITCNYDGIKKNPTSIGKKVFIGSNTALVAPVKVGDGAMIGAGSVITEDIPAYALALGRAKQVNKEGWVLKKRRDILDEK